MLNRKYLESVKIYFEEQVLCFSMNKQMYNF